MKLSLLKRLLKQNGAKFYCLGGSHDKWISKNGKKFSVPRHHEVIENTAKDILKQSML